MTTRRGFLKGMLGLGGAIVAGPAICKAENLMKILVPSQDILLAREIAAIDLSQTVTQSLLSQKHIAVPRFAGDFDGDTVTIYKKDEQILFTRHPIVGRGSVIDVSEISIRDLQVLKNAEVNKRLLDSLELMKIR